MTAALCTEAPPADPDPLLRCRCVHRAASYAVSDWPPLALDADDYLHRCPGRATEEDGLCDHCRGGVRPLSDEPWRGIGTCFTCGDDWRCCLHPTQHRRLVAPLTPCAAVLEEMPF